MKIPKWVAETLDRARTMEERDEDADKLEIWGDQTENAEYLVAAYLNPLTKKYVEIEDES